MANISININKFTSNESSIFSVQLKPMGNYCNARCDYCYAKSYLAPRKIMPMDTLEILIKKILDQKSLYPTFSWHGGEPTAVGINFFKNAITIMKKYRKSNQTIINQIQTNGTLITRELANFFHDNNFGVSVSLDGPPKIHGLHRKFSNGENTFDSVMRGIENLKAADINPGILCTVTKGSLSYATEIFDFFIDCGFNKIKFNPVFDSIQDKFSLSNEEWLEFLKNIFNKWFELGDPNIQVRELDETISWISGTTINHCIGKKTCLSWISVNPNGDVYPCEYLKEDFYYGNIHQLALKDIINSEKYQKLSLLYNVVPKKCKHCSFYNLCGNGCPVTRIDNGNLSMSGIYVFCEQKKYLYHYINNKFDEVLSSRKIMR